MNRTTALSLIDKLLSNDTALIDKHRAAEQLRELISILLPDEPKRNQPNHD